MHPVNRLQLDRVVFAAMLVVVTSAWAQTSQPAELEKGMFKTTFTERSPLSAVKELAKRLPAKPPPPDYNLAEQQFVVYVPKDYDPAQAYGVVVYLNYKATDTTPPTWNDLLDRSKLIFVVSANQPDPVSTRVGLSLDAIHNLKKKYHIDDQRVWAMGEEAAEDLALGFPEVFTAGIYRNVVYFRPLNPHRAGFGMYPAAMASIPGEYVSKAKAHRHVILLFTEVTDYTKLAVAAFAQDGFKQVLTMEVDKEPYHYPNFTTDWFEKVIAFLDAPGAAVAAAAVTTAPASSPVAAKTQAAASDPQKLLNLAKNYISAKNYAGARTRLNTIVEKFPNDPAAAEARQLLQSLPAE